MVRAARRRKLLDAALLPCLAQLLGGRGAIDGEREDYGVWGDRRRRRRRRERRRKAHRR
jgi:hypothetical protein